MSVAISSIAHSIVESNINKLSWTNCYCVSAPIQSVCQYLVWHSLCHMTLQSVTIVVEHVCVFACYTHTTSVMNESCTNGHKYDLSLSLCSRHTLSFSPPPPSFSPSSPLPLSFPLPSLPSLLCPPSPPSPLSVPHTQLMRLRNVSRDLLPPKKLSGNLSKHLIDKRRQLLESYLQKMIHSEAQISQSTELLDFLDVPAHVSVM